MQKNSRIVLSYTNREWIIIEKSIEDTGNKNGVASHIIKEVSKLDHILQDITEENKVAITKITKRQYYPPQSSLDKLIYISNKLNIPPSTIVSRLIINPLLKR